MCNARTHASHARTHARTCQRSQTDHMSEELTEHMSTPLHHHDPPAARKQKAKLYMSNVRLHANRVHTLPFKGGRVELTLLLELLEQPGLDESAPPCHHCYALMLIHAPGGLQAQPLLLGPCSPQRGSAEGGLLGPQ